MSTSLVRFTLENWHHNYPLAFLLHYYKNYQITLAQRVGAILMFFTYLPTSITHVVQQGLELQSASRIIPIKQQLIKSERHGRVVGVVGVVVVVHCHINIVA